MSILRLAFELYLAAPRAYSAKDVEARLSIDVANARKITCALRVRGCIQESFRLGSEKFFEVVPGAAPPEDLRTVNDPKRARQARLMRIRQARRGLKSAGR